MRLAILAVGAIVALGAAAFLRANTSTIPNLAVVRFDTRNKHPPYETWPTN